MTLVEISNLSPDGEGGLEVSFYLPESDVKAPGVARLQTLIIPKGADYDDEIDAVMAAIKHVVLDVLEDFDGMKSAYVAPEPA